MEDKKTERIGVRLTPEERQRLEQLAKEQNISISQLVRDLCI